MVAQSDKPRLKTRANVNILVGQLDMLQEDLEDDELNPPGHLVDVALAGCDVFTSFLNFLTTARTNEPETLQERETFIYHCAFLIAHLTEGLATLPTHEQVYGQPVEVE